MPPVDAFKEMVLDPAASRFQETLITQLTWLALYQNCLPARSHSERFSKSPKIKDPFVLNTPKGLAVRFLPRRKAWPL